MTDIALKVYLATKRGVIKSNADFWKNFSREELFNNIEVSSAEINQLKSQNIDVICAFDENFPKICGNIKQSERPYLFIFRGDISLLSGTSKNVAVVGTTSISEEILEREKHILEKLQDFSCIISGLALGCDTAAHLAAINAGKKTVAFLPSTLQKIYPTQNAILAEKIIACGGLIITEYVNEPKDRFECIKRFIERDRLQAMFSCAIILVASFRQGEGDSGSRHAMQKAKEYKNRHRLVMFNHKTDSKKPIFGLNEDLLKEEDVRVLSNNLTKF